MAATNLTAPAVFPFVANITLGTGGNVRLVNLPANLDLDITLNARATDAKLLDGSLALADDDAISTNPYFSLKAGIPVTVTISRGGATSKLYLASATSSQVVEVIVQRRQLGA